MMENTNETKDVSKAYTSQSHRYPIDEEEGEDRGDIDVEEDEEENDNEDHSEEEDKELQSERRNKEKRDGAKRATEEEEEEEEEDMLTESTSMSASFDDDLSESSPGEPDYEQSYAQELSKANLLLRKTGVNSKPMMSVDELQKCASSMFVAVVESMLNRRMKSVVRVPKRRFDYVRNAQSVIDVLNVVLRSSLQVSAQRISEGHLPSICNLVSVLLRMQELIASKRLKIPKSLLISSNKFLPEPGDLGTSMEGISSTVKNRRRNKHGGIAPSDRQHKLLSEISELRDKLYVRDDLNIHSNDASESQSMSLPSTGYQRALELLGGKRNEAKAGEYLMSSKSQSWIDSQRDRAARLIQLQYKQEAAAHQRQQLRARKLYRLLEQSQKHARTVERVKQNRFRNSLLMKKISHQVELQAKQSRLWRDVKKKLLRMGRIELEDQRVLQREMLEEIERNNLIQLEAENHAFRQRQNMLRETMNEEHQAYTLRRSSQVDEFRKQLRRQKLMQKKELAFMRDKIDTQHHRHMEELEENIENILNAHMDASRMSAIPNDAETRRSHDRKRHINLLKAYGRPL